MTPRQQLEELVARLNAEGCVMCLSIPGATSLTWPIADIWLVGDVLYWVQTYPQHQGHAHATKLVGWSFPSDEAAWLDFEDARNGERFYLSPLRQWDHKPDVTEAVMSWRNELAAKPGNADGFADMVEDCLGSRPPGRIT